MFALATPACHFFVVDFKVGLRQTEEMARACVSQEPGSVDINELRNYFFGFFFLEPLKHFLELHREDIVP